MKFTRSILSISTVAVILSLSACSSGNGNFSRNTNWGNYKCKAAAMPKGSKYVGWSISKSKAESNALDKCQNSTGKSCHILSCQNAM